MPTCIFHKFIIKRKNSKLIKIGRILTSFMVTETIRLISIYFGLFAPTDLQWPLGTATAVTSCLRPLLAYILDVIKSDVRAASETA